MLFVLSVSFHLPARHGSANRGYARPRLRGRDRSGRTTARGKASSPFGEDFREQADSRTLGDNRSCSGGYRWCSHAPTWMSPTKPARRSWTVPLGDQAGRPSISRCDRSHRSRSAWKKPAGCGSGWDGSPGPRRWERAGGCPIRGDAFAALRRTLGGRQSARHVPDRHGARSEDRVLQYSRTSSSTKIAQRADHSVRSGGKARYAGRRPVRAADAGTVLPLRRLPYGGVSPGPGYARHADGGAAASDRAAAMSTTKRSSAAPTA